MPYEFIDEEPQESILGTIGRGVARTGARVAEAGAGIFGDVTSGVLGLGNLASRALTGSEIPGVSTVQDYLPTSEKIRKKVTEPLTGEYLKPQGAFESGLDTLVGDIASLLTPGGMASKGASLTGKALVRAGARAAGAGLIGKGVEELSGSPTAGAIAKGLTLAVSNTAGGRKALGKSIKADYMHADEAIPKNFSIRDQPLRRTLVSDIKRIEKGVSPNKKDMLEVLRGSESNFFSRGATDGNIKVKDLWNLKKNVNEWLRDPDLPKPVRSQLKKTNGDLNKSLSTYAENNPRFGNPFHRAEEMTRNMEQSTQFTQFLRKNATIENFLKSWKPLSLLGYTLKGMGVPVAGLLGGVGLTAGVPGGVKHLANLTELLARSSHARKYYTDLIKAGATGDVAAAQKNMKSLDQIAAKEQGHQQGRYEFIS